MAVKEIINCIDEIINNLYNYNINIYEKLSGIIPDINKLYQDFINIIPKLNEIGFDISMEGIISQIKELSDAIENRDKVLMFDTLNYEVKDTLEFYDEILRIMNE